MRGGFAPMQPGREARDTPLSPSAAGIPHGHPARPFYLMRPRSRSSAPPSQGVKPPDAGGDDVRRDDVIWRLHVITSHVITFVITFVTPGRGPSSPRPRGDRKSGV